MRLFTRPRRAPAPVPVRLHWLPDGDEPQVHPASVVDDDGCAAEQVHSVRYIWPFTPGASVTVYLYPAYAGADERDGYVLGWMWVRRMRRVGEQPLVDAGWDSLSRLHYDNLTAAADDIAARAWSAAQTYGPLPVGDHGPDPFDWDGQPW